MNMGQSLTTWEMGEIVFASGFAVIGDPCYIRTKEDLVAGLELVMANGLHCDTDEGVLLAVPTTTATVYARTGSEGRTMQMLFSFTGEEDIAGREKELCHLGVDAGMILTSDATRAITDFVHDDYQDVRIFEHTASGRTLQYMVDFPHFQAPIASEGGKTMNDLVATGEWKQLPPSDDLLKYTYSGVAKHEEKASYYDKPAALIDGFAAISSSGWGDGSYPLTAYLGDDGNVLGFLIDFTGEEEGDEEDDEG